MNRGVLRGYRITWENMQGLKDLNSAASANHFVCLGHGLGVQAARAETAKPIGIVLNFTPGRVENRSDSNILL